MAIVCGGSRLPRRFGCLLLGLWAGVWGVWPIAPVLALPGDLGVAAQPVAAKPVPQSIQPYLDRLRRRVTEFKLANGMQFIVLERHDAPVVSFVTYANVGASDEVMGQTGIAHFLEHLAFKGTRSIGTTDYAAESKVLQRMDEVFEALKVARQKGDKAHVAVLMQQMADLKKQAAQYIRQNELGQVIEQSGGVGLNAATSADSTTYFYSLPSNKLELWMSLESERFLQPVFREFYEEREVILEERRMRLENDPTSQLIAAVADKAYDRHPYGTPIIGERSDIENLTRKNVQDFFDRHYGPENLTVAIVGDVDPKRAKALAEQYFGRLAKRPVPPVTLAQEPPQKAEREVQVQLQSQPWYVEAYHSPAGDDPDGLTASILESVLSSGRTSRLYRSLVEEQRVALAAQGMTGYPGDKYPNLMLFYAITAPGKTLNDVQVALRKELERVVNEPVTVAELDRIKTQTRASVLKSLTSNTGMAQTLAEYKVKRGSWQMLFADLEAIDRLTPADLQRVARKILRPENRTVGRLIPKGE